MTEGDWAWSMQEANKTNWVGQPEGIKTRTNHAGQG